MSFPFLNHIKTPRPSRKLLILKEFSNTLNLRNQISIKNLRLNRDSSKSDTSQEDQPARKRTEKNDLGNRIRSTADARQTTRHTTDHNQPGKRLKTRLNRSNPKNQLFQENAKKESKPEKPSGQQQESQNAGHTKKEVQNAGQRQQQERQERRPEGEGNEQPGQQEQPERRRREVL